MPEATGGWNAVLRDHVGRPQHRAHRAGRRPARHRPGAPRRLAHLRRVGARVDARSLAGVDAVLVSHLHYDHLDVPSLLRLGRSVEVVLPSGSTRLLRRRGFTRIASSAGGEEPRIGAVTVACDRGRAAGERLPFSLDRPAVGYLVSGSADLVRR